MRKNNKKDNYEIGYGKPPQKTRFQKGKSGNPSGRPKGVKNYQQQLDAVLSEKITVTTNGKQRRISKLTAMFIQLSNNALKGDRHALRLLLSQMTRRDINSVSADLERLENEKKPINVYVTPSDLHI